MIYNQHILKKIRSEIIKILSFNELFLGSHYYVYQKMKTPIFIISTGSENRYQVSKLKTLLETTGLQAKLNLIDSNNLCIDTTILYQNEFKLSKKFKNQRNEIIRYLCEGYSQKEIIEKLNFSVGGFHDLKKRVLNSINCKTIADIIVYALKNRLYSTADTKRQTLKFTEKERKLIKGTCIGKSDKEISQEINLSVFSIPVYRNRLLKRIGGKTSADIIIYAFKNGLLYL